MTVEKIVDPAQLALDSGHDPHRIGRRSDPQVAQYLVEGEILALGLVEDLESPLPRSATLATTPG